MGDHLAQTRGLQPIKLQTAPEFEETRAIDGVIEAGSTAGTQTSLDAILALSFKGGIGGDGRVAAREDPERLGEDK